MPISTIIAPTTYTPSAALAPYINNYKVIESVEGTINRVVPNASMALVFRYKGAINYDHLPHMDALPPFVLSGLFNTHRLISYAPDSAAIIVAFKTAAFRAFFAMEAQTFFNNSIALDELISRQEYHQVAAALDSAINTKERIAGIEQFLLQRLTNHQPDLLITTAAEKIIQANGLIRIKDLAAALYISQDAFEKRFRKHVGSSPKKFSSIIRMRSLLSNGNDHKLLDKAFTAGFYDQAHFNHAFKSFTGLTPTSLLATPAFW